MSDSDVERNRIVAECERLIACLEAIPQSQPGFEEYPYLRARAHWESIAALVKDSAEWLSIHAEKSHAFASKPWLQLQLRCDGQAARRWPIEDVVRDLGFVRAIVLAAGSTGRTDQSATQFVRSTDTTVGFSRDTRAAILELVAERREGQRKALDCLWKCFDIIARERLNAQGTLSEVELTQRIPELVLEAAVEFGWVKYPRLRRVQQAKTSPAGWKTLYRVSEAVPNAQLVETVGQFRLEAGFTARWRRMLSGREAHWQAEALKHAALGIDNRWQANNNANSGSADPELQSPPRAQTERKHRKSKNDPHVQHIKAVVRKLRNEGLDFRAICKRLDDSARPPRATWRDLTWPVAYMRNTSAVTKWLSEACK